MKNITVEAGQVFAVPLTEEMYGFGQLLVWQRPVFYMIAYDLKAASPDASENDVRSATPVLMGNFFDILIRDGRWPVVRKQAVPKVPFPCFKTKIADKYCVESWDRKRMRAATPEECDALQLRSNHSAIVLESALKAYFGLSPWQAKFDHLRTEAVATCSKVLANC